MSRMAIFASSVALVACVLMSPLASAEVQDNPLYRAQVIVTGDREETRIPIIPEGFQRAAQKLTGNPDIAENPNFASVASKASSFLWSYTYHDRMFGRPIHDEQGTRDRPFDLTLQFDQKLMDAALAKLGESAWLSNRPTLGLIVSVTDMANTYVLASDGLHGEDQRASFADAAARFAIPIRFPAQAGISQPPDIENLKSIMHVDDILEGSLAWDAKALGWKGRWHLATGAQKDAWEISGVNFDAAFRNAMGGAAKRLRPRSP